jgi:putative sigma-54 modulation protein
MMSSPPAARSLPRHGRCGAVEAERFTASRWRRWTSPAVTKVSLGSCSIRLDRSRAPGRHVAGTCRTMSKPIRSAATSRAGVGRWRPGAQKEALEPMQVSVSSRHTELSTALRAAATEKIGRLDRFLEGMDRAEVHFTEETSSRTADRQLCEVTLEGHGHHVRCKVSAPDGFVAVDRAVEKLEQQLAKLKTRKTRKGAPVLRRPSTPAGTVIAESEPGSEDDETSMADDAYIARDGSAIVKRKSFAGRPMKVDDAILQLELLDHDFFLFTNVDSGNSAVLYRRHHGGLGLIEQVR